MRSEWKEIRLGDVASVKGGKRLPKGKNLQPNPTIHPYIRVRDLNNKRLLCLTDDFEYVDEETFEYISRYIVESGDLIISIVGTIGLVALIDESLHHASLTENCAKIIDVKEIDNKYLYYYLSSEFGRKEIEKGIVGAVQAKLPLKNIQDISVFAPPISEQRAIAATLSCLDDKMELNSKINANVEAQAQAIFKSWFVDFEPFQDGEFVDSELGRIPKGWRVGTLSEFVNVRYGKDHKKLADGDIPVYGSGGVMRYAEKALYESESVLIPRKGTLNNVIYINEPFWTVDTMFFTEMLRPHVAKFVYFFVSSKDLAAMNAGSAVPSMTTDILNNLQVVIAPEAIFESYNAVVTPMFNSIDSNQKQTRALSALRDTLLPKLMNGEINVPLEES